MRPGPILLIIAFIGRSFASSVHRRYFENSPSRYRPTTSKPRPVANKEKTSEVILGRRSIPDYRCVEISDEEGERLVPEGSSEREIDPAEEFVNYLKSFVSVDSFDIVAFEAEFQHIDRRLTQLSELYEGGEKQERKTQQLQFAHHLFEAMDKVMIIHAKIATSENEEKFPLAYEMRELTVRALALRNSLGEPDRQMKDFQRRVLMLYDSVAFMRAQFESYLSEAEQLTHSMLNDVFGHAKDE